MGNHRACLNLLLTALLPCLIAGASGPVHAESAAEVKAVLDDPDLTYTTAFTWTCPDTTWERVLDEPLLMGRLWEAYGYAPAYRFSAQGGVLHVDDPTGMQGDAVLVQRAAGTRTWLVHGKINHWAVPFFNEGTAVFVLTSQPVGEQIAGELKVYLSAESMVGSLAMAVGQPLLTHHINNRVTLNLQDSRRIVETVAARPGGAAGLLIGEEAARFRARFGG